MANLGLGGDLIGKGRWLKNFIPEIWRSHEHHLVGTEGTINVQLPIEDSKQPNFDLELCVT